MQPKKIIDLILSAIPMAMGIAVLVISIVSPETAVSTFISMLGIGMFSLGLLAIRKLSDK